VTHSQTPSIREALRKAFKLGQTYWQQADSDSYKQNKKSVLTRQQFDELVEETCAALTTHPEPQPCQHPSWTSIPGGKEQCALCGAIGVELRYLKVDASPPPAAQEPAHPVGQEDIERLKFDIRQAMIEYGSAYKNNHEEGIRETTSRCCALLDSLAILASKEQRNADR